MVTDGKSSFLRYHPPVLKYKIQNKQINGIVHTSSIGTPVEFVAVMMQSLLSKITPGAFV